MGIMQLMTFLFLGLFHLSLAKDCLDCTNKDDAAFQYISNRLTRGLPQGMENEEQAELVQIKEELGKVDVFIYDFVARGLKSNSLFDCELIDVVIEGTSLVFEKKCECKVIPSSEPERSIYGEELAVNMENNLQFNKKKYMNCMKKAAIRCLL